MGGIAIPGSGRSWWFVSMKKDPYRRFDHTGMRDQGLPEISGALDAYLKKVRACMWLVRTC